MSVGGKLFDGNSRFCGLELVVPTSLMLAAADGLCRWPQRRITYYEAFSFGPAGVDVHAAYDAAWRQWADVCGIEPVRIPSRDRANIAAGQGAIDGPWGTLAWSYLPCGAVEETQLIQQYDDQETWTHAFMVACACHEIGHALGLSHLGPGNLMAPVLDRQITRPQPGDIAEIQARYGLPGSTPASTPTPTPTSVPGGLALDGVFREYTLELGEDKRFKFTVPGQWFANQRRVHFTAPGLPGIALTVYGRKGRPLFRGDAMFAVRLMPGTYSLGVMAPGQQGTFHLAAKLA